MTVRQMLASMDSVELTEWASYITIENEDRNRKPGDNVEEDIKRAFGKGKGRR